VAPEGDFLFLRHHNRFGDGVDRHGGSRSGHGSWGWRSGSTLWCCGRNRFQMVSVTIWGQHHQWIINESSICLQSWEIWEMPLFILGIGYWMQWNYHTNATYVRYFTDDLIAQKPTYIDTIRNIHNHLKRRAWQGTIENVYAKKTHDTWFNLRIYYYNCKSGAPLLYCHHDPKNQVDMHKASKRSVSSV
jgi:hypothetical protein